jgi:hypothetical protein
VIGWSLYKSPRRQRRRVIERKPTNLARSPSARTKNVGQDRTGDELSM